MSYDKLSLASFKEALKSNKYETATAARRAVGKAATLSASEKDSARRAIDSHFGESAPVVKTSPKAIKAIKAGKKAARTPVTKAPALVRQPRTPKEEAAPSVTPPAATLQPALINLDDIGSVATQLRIADKIIISSTNAFNALRKDLETNPELDISEARANLANAISSAARIFTSITNLVEGVQSPTPKHAPKTSIAAFEAPADKSANGTQSTPVGEKLFRESTPQPFSES